MKMKQWLFMGVYLGFLPGLALAPEKYPVMNMKTAETALYMQMWGNFSHEQKASEQVECEGTEGTADAYPEIQDDTTAQQTTDASMVESMGTGVESQKSGGINEQAASEEMEEEAPGAGAGGNNAQYQDTETVCQKVEVPVSDNQDTTVETEVESPQAASPLYTVGGVMLDEGIQNYLYQRLAENGIPWFMPYAVLIAYGESSFNIYAENPNGRDKGLFQYRVEYVPWMDWTNPYQQIDYFVSQMANRAANGKTVSEMISAHNMSDYGPYNQAYVDHVMSMAGALVQVR